MKIVLKWSKFIYRQNYKNWLKYNRQSSFRPDRNSSREKEVLDRIE